MTFQAFRCVFTSQIKNELTKNALKHQYPKYSVSFRFVHRAPQEKAEPSDVLVYEAPLCRRIRITKIVSLSSSGMALAMLPHALSEISRASLALACAAALVSSAFLSTPLLLHWVTRRYVLRLCYEQAGGCFSATTYDLVGREVVTEFTAEEVLVPQIPGFLSSFEVRGRPLFVDSRLVSDPDAYSHMMGYDKPIDLNPDHKSS